MRIRFDGEGSWSFGNDFAGNVVFFGADNSSSSHADNQKQNFLALGEGPEKKCCKKKISINFSKENAKFCLSLHYNCDESYFYVNKTEICKFKVNVTYVGIFF